MNRLFLLFHGRFPGEKAASLFAAKSAEAFAEKGFEVTLVAPRRKGVEAIDPFAYYGVKNNFKVAYTATIDFFGIPGLKFVAFWASFIVFSFSSYLYLKKSSGENDVIYSNETLPLSLASRIRKNTFYEMHDFPESKLSFFRRFLSKMRWVLVHNRWKLEEVRRLFPSIPSDKFLYEPNAVDLKEFDVSISKEEARRKLSLPATKKIVVYTGHLYGWKGVDTLVQAAKFLPKDYLVAFVGGTDADVKRFRDLYGKESSILIAGHKPHAEIPVWQKAADVLVLPNTAKEKISALYTSPMKLYEYMASNRPIVASDIPSIREVAGNDSAMLVSPDDAKALAFGIQSAVEDAASAQKRAKSAFAKVSSHTWDKRAERIAAFMKI